MKRKCGVIVARERLMFRTYTHMFKSHVMKDSSRTELRQINPEITMIERNNQHKWYIQGNGK